IPEEPADKLRSEIAWRGNALANFPEGHPARMLFLDEAAHLVGQVQQEEAAAKQRAADAARREVVKTRAIGASLALLGAAATIWRIPEGGFLLWAGIVAVALGALTIYGASD
ncbi:hypothetical protein AB0D90_31280, partial [Streptomyces althioticus]